MCCHTLLQVLKRLWPSSVPDFFLAVLPFPVFPSVYLSRVVPDDRVVAAQVIHMCITAQRRATGEVVTALMHLQCFFSSLSKFGRQGLAAQP